MTSRSLLALVPLLAGACGPAARPALPEPVTGFDAATGGARWQTVQAIEQSGTLSAGGLSGSYRAEEDVRTGRSRTRYTLGPIQGADGFDGQVSWSQAGGGEVEIADGPEAVARARTGAWMIRRGYAEPSGARWRDLGERADRGRRYRVLEATPEGGAPIELWFDAAGGLLARTRHREGRKTVVTTLDDYRDIGGVRIPFRTEVDRGDPRERVTITVTEAHLREALPAATFARPATDAERASFVGGAARAEVPFDLVNNHIFVDAQVDGKPVRMLVDTGGLNLLVPASAARLGLKPEGKLAAGGTGARQVDVAMAHAAELSVGAVRLARPLFYVVDLGALADVEGEDFDGLVGFELFHRFVVRIDYDAARLTLMDRAGFTAPAGAAAIRFELDDRTPVVAGSIDGLPARITIDTGARNSLTTHAPFTREHRLVDRYRPRFEAVTGWGVGGPTRGHPVRFGEVRLGDVVVRAVAGELFTGDKGALADPDVSANLGGGILRRFIVTFDYAARTMYLEPGPGRDARDGYDRLGAWLMRAGDAIRIGAVTPGGPAERAGLQVDDRLLAIDGAPAGSRRLADWRTRFRDDPPGTRVRFTVDRGGARREVTAVLAELLP